MISVTELRAGTIFEDQGKLFVVVSYEHIKVGRGSANVKVRVRNIRSGATTDRSFISNARVAPVALSKKQLQYLYKDQDQAYFMDSQNFEQVEIPLRIIPEHAFLKEGENYSVSYYQGEPLSLLMPPKIDLKVFQTGPSIKGNSASNVYKDAILENGLKTKVPLFIKEGDRVRVDTRTGSYSEKVK